MIKLPHNLFFLMILLTALFQLDGQTTRKDFIIRTIQKPVINANGNYATTELSYETTALTSVEVQNGNYEILARSPQANKHYISVIGLNVYQPTVLKVIFRTDEYAPVTESFVLPPAGTLPFDPNLTIDVKGRDDLQHLISGPQKSFIMTEGGRISWMNTQYNMVLDVLENGNLLALVGKEMGFMSSTLIEVSLAGRVQRMITVANYLYGSAIPFKEGYLLPSNSRHIVRQLGFQQPGLQDAIMQLNNDGEIVEMWKMQDYLDIKRQPLTFEGRPGDWVHLNSIGFNHNTNTMTASLRNQGAIIGFDPWKKTLKWILASENYPTVWDKKWGKRRLNIAAQDAPKATGPIVWLENNNMLVFDFGVYNSLNDNLSRIVEYRIDEKNKTAFLVEEYKLPSKRFNIMDADLHALAKNELLTLYRGVASLMGDVSETVLLRIRNENFGSTVVWKARANDDSRYYKILPLGKEYTQLPSSTPKIR